MWHASLLVVVLLRTSSAQQYDVPESRLEALWPSGIRVSIPDSPGVELFAFHGSVNKPLRYLAAGDMSRDILRTRQGRWVFEDLTVTLKPGDVLYYWLYVQVRGRGYQRTNLYWIVESYVPDYTSTVPLPQESYSVPEARVEPLLPHGLRVSIPDTPGLELFAFHGNVNRPMDSLESGTMSKDIVQPINGRWVFKDSNVVLKKGDTIYYWTYVIRNGLGYRRDNQKFVVKELFPTNVVPLQKPNVTVIMDEKVPDKEMLDGKQEGNAPQKQTPCDMKEVKLPEGLEFKVVVKDGKLVMIPIIPEVDRRLAV